tara:strand:+ start:75 stop:758 length:684 start_codon:yes stop_codon:yes gene_type:complete
MKKKYNRGGQGYAAREDESLGMRTGAERTKRQSMRDRRDESYGAFGNRPNQRINRKRGGVGRGDYGTQTPRDRAGDAMEQVLKDMGKKGEEGHRAPLSLNQKIKITASTLPNRKNNVFTAVATGKKVKQTSYNMGGTMKNYRDGGVEAADKEGSRLSISMERQEDAGFSPSEADFDQQHRLAEEGIMEVGADVTTIQGHNSRASLGETEGVRGTGAMVKGTKFDGVF